MPVKLYFVGTAGSGKTTLTNEFKNWMTREGFQTVTVNLDPGVSNLPYEPDIDVRDWISINEIMDRYELGPNGAQIVSADMLAVNALEIKEVMNTYECHYFLIDTPGQIELFTFRESSRETVRMLGFENSMIAFLFDPVVTKTPSGFLSMNILAAITHFRMNIPYLPLLSKSDLLSEDELESIENWAKDSMALETDIRDMESPESTLGTELVRGLEEVSLKEGIQPVSSFEQTGFEDIYTEVQTVFYGGEDIESS
ncbi:MAG: ATP/GTP-binding protein [Thermoplasmata archaeon]